MQPSIDVSDFEERPAASRQRIFVVEDDEDIGRLIRHNLVAAGYDVQNFLSSNNVVSQAQREQPSLFLLDVMLPGSDGFDLCRQIRQDPKLAKIPIIFLTARTDEADRVKGLELGGDDYITKPFSPRELVARVRTVLRAVPEVSPAETLRLSRR
jgi:DNA-binding response OmpR family regulator